MQVIGPTYRSFGAPKMGYPAPVAYGVSEQPLANTYAGIHYAQSAYGPNLLNSRGGIGSGHGYARGTDGAAAGWALTGEQGPELVKMRGGETVLPAHVTSAILSGGQAFPGYAAGAIPAAVRNQAQKASASSVLSGIIAGAPKEGWSKDVADLKHELAIIATSLGIKGLSKADTSKLKGEQGKDENELLVATAYLGKLQAAKKQITGVTEPQLRKQISALASLGKSQKLSASENRLLKTLKASLAAQQAKLGRIDTAIYGKAAAKAKPKPATGADGSGGDTGGGDAGGGGGGGDTSTPKGQFVGVLPGPPGTAPGDITGGGSGGVGGTGSTVTGIGGFSSNLGAGYRIAPPMQQGGGGPGGGTPAGFGGTSIEMLLSQILSATRAAPAQTGGHLVAGLNGVSRQAYSRATWG